MVSDNIAIRFEYSDSEKTAYASSVKYTAYSAGLVQVSTAKKTSFEKEIELLKEENFLLCILSNNGEERVGKFAAPLGLEYIAHAKKPSSEGVLRALSLLQVEALLHDDLSAII